MTTVSGPAGGGRTPIEAVILGTTALNGGDAALLDGELETLRLAFGDVAVTIFDQHPDATARLYPDLRVRPTLTWPRGAARRGAARDVAWLVRLARLLVAAVALRCGRAGIASWTVPHPDDLADLERYRRADLALTPAGTMLVDQHTFLPRLVDWLIVLILGRPLVVFTQTLGRFDRRIERLLARAVLSRAALVLVRGQESADRARGLGAGADRVHEAADPAFLLASDPLGAPPIRARRRVAVSVRNWPFFADADGPARYAAGMRALCARLARDHDSDVEFVSTCQGVPEYWTDDAAVAAELVAGLPADVAARVTVDRAHRSPAALRDHYARFDLVVATRLHAAILALDAGTPVVAVAYESKTAEVFGRLDTPELVVGIDPLDAEQLCAVVDRVLAERYDVAARLRSAVAEERAAARAVAVLVRNVVPRTQSTLAPSVAA